MVLGVLTGWDRREREVVGYYVEENRGIPNYDWFDPTWKMEKRRLWIRSGAYFLGFVLATVIIPEIG